MIELLPAVHRFLILLLALLEEDVDDAGVGDIAVLLKVLADAVSDERWRDVEGVDGANLRSLRLDAGTLERMGVGGREAERTPRYQSRYNLRTRLRASWGLEEICAVRASLAGIVDMSSERERQVVERGRVRRRQRPSSRGWTERLHVIHSGVTIWNGAAAESS